MNLAKSKILISGGAGFLGSHLVKNLIEKRKVPPSQIVHPSSKKVDLRIEKNVRKIVQGIDVVIHAAALTGGVQFHKEHPAQVFFANAMMTTLLMEEARKAGVRKFVGIGTATEYPKAAPVPLRESDIWNGEPEESQFAYSAVKRAMLVQGQAYRQEYGFNAIHLLMSTMYGPGDNWSGTYVIPSLTRTIMQAKKENRPYFEGWGTGKATRDFLYIEDAAEGVLLATESYDKAEPLNIGSGVETPMADVLTLIAKYLDYKGEIRWDSTKPEGQLKKFLDMTQTQREIGFKAKTPFAEGLKKTIDEYLLLNPKS